jgi:putative PIN family toxin of toxin-antitoxin system
LRVLLDTNVLLSGLFTSGVCERILDACWGPIAPLVAVCSDYLLDEFLEVAQNKFHVSADDVADAETRIRTHFTFVEPLPVAGEACRDPVDLPVLGAALAGQVEFLVTGDRDLLDLRQFQGMAILSPREFYERLRAGNGSMA